MITTVGGAGDLSRATHNAGRRKVQLRFGDHVLATHIVAADLAERYAEATRRRFQRARGDQRADPVGRPAAGGDMPGEQLWSVTP